MNLEMPSITRYQLYICILIVILGRPLDLGLLDNIDLGADGGYVVLRHGWSKNDGR